MLYYKYNWIHNFEDEPILFFIELDDDRWVRKVLEIYKDGRQSYADVENEFGTFLGKEPYPPDNEINDGIEFFIIQITKKEFEIEWSNKIKDYYNRYHDLI